MSLSAAERAVIGNVEKLAADIVELTRALVRIPTVNPPGDAYADCAEPAQPGRCAARLHACETLAAEGLPEHTARVSAPQRRRRARQRRRGPPCTSTATTTWCRPARAGRVDPFGARGARRTHLRSRHLRPEGRDRRVDLSRSKRSGARACRCAAPSSRARPPTRKVAASPAWPGCADHGHLSRARQRYVVITEPLDPERVCIGHRGVYWFELTTLGRVGHGSMPGLAVNAAEQMARLIRAIDAELKPRLAERHSRAPVEPPQARQPRINLNALHAGQDARWLADAACAGSLHGRLRSTVHSRGALRRRRARDRGLARAPGHPVRAARPDARRPAARSTSGETWRTRRRGDSRRARHVAELHRQSRAPSTRSTSSAARASTQCIGYGPGRLVLAHQPDEYVAIDDLVASSEGHGAAHAAPARHETG